MIRLYIFFTILYFYYLIFKIEIYVTAIADQILEKVLTRLNIEDKSNEEKFNNIYKIFPELDRLNEEGTFSVSTTGTITERICGWALDAALPNGYYRLTSRSDKWLGDYVILGVPFNVVISVKSYKVKERLLVSGSGSLLVPTIGWGFMDDPNEFKYERLQSYLYRGFIAIYMPNFTLQKVENESLALENVHKRKFLRPIENLVNDIKNAIEEKKFGQSVMLAVNPRKF